MDINQSANSEPVASQYESIAQKQPLNNKMSIQNPNFEQVGIRIDYEKEDDDKKSIIVEDEDQEHENLSDATDNAFGLFIIRLRTGIYNFLMQPFIKWVLIGLFIIGFPIYFGVSMYLHPPFSWPAGDNSTTILEDYVFSNNRGIALLILTFIVALFALWDNLFSKLIEKYKTGAGTYSEKFQVPEKYKPHLPWIIISIVTVLCVAFLIYDLTDPYNLISLLGLFVFLFICVLISEHPSRISWRALAVGILMQYILGVFILRLQFGYDLFQFLGSSVSTFLDYTDNGCRLVFGEHFADHFFAFKAMPVVIFFSAMVNILYYFGAIQYFLLKIAWVVNLLMGTSPCESVNSVANVFLGPSEAPLLIKPFLATMTPSELFAVMTAAFSTVSGSVLAAYIGFGIAADHLITAGMMSAPASLAIAKIIFPETKKTKATFLAIKNVKAKKVNNVFEAISTGAVDMIAPIGAILANLIAFIAIFSFLEATVTWFFSMLSIENFGLASILSYLFYPFAFLMGVEGEDCLNVAKLVGYKVFVNEFVAFTKLGGVENFRKAIIANGTYDLYYNGTLPIPDGMPMIWNYRSILITTYALCGFANFGSVGIEIATLSVFAPTRTKIVIKYALKAMLAGNFSSFMNACIAGLLYKKA